MLSQPIVGVSLMILCLLAWIMQRVRASFLRSHEALRRGCEDAPTRINKCPGGIDHVARLLIADRDGQVPTEYLKIYEEQGEHTYAHTILGVTQVMTIEPPNIQAVLATQFQDFEVGPIRRKNFAPLLGNGIFTADGKFWERSRQLLRPQFTRGQIADLELEERHLKSMLRLLETRAPGWTPIVDMKPLLFRFTMDTATEFLFGASVNSQAQTRCGITQTSWNSFAEAFDRCTATLGIRTRLSGLYWLYNPKDFQVDIHVIHSFADHFINTALQPGNYNDTDHLTDKYVFLQELAKVLDDPVEIRSQLLHILLAGRDTTAGLLGWALWNLSRQPHIYQKLRETVMETFGTYQAPQGISFEALKSCVYLQYILKETLRLFPTVPLNTRQAAHDTTLPVGGGPNGLSPVFVPKGTEIGYSVYAMHRRKDLWGEDAHIFNPDRWANRKSGWDYLPFNGGPRICLGQQFALTEAGYVLTRLLQRFDRLENCDPETEPLHSYNLTSAPKQVLVRFHEVVA